ncbi:segregation and condensation protein A [Rhodococcus sp. BP22]|uniref:segregation and condensation protein A n=1 Tax=Rhodococcus sp. BP22 TaxID=2758566 RepID=UPI0037C82FB5
MVSTATPGDAPIEVPGGEDPSRFRVRLLNFEGPFDLLLTLISQHRLDVTEVALHTVTDDFIAFTKSLGKAMDLDQTTEFLVVAATLLDLKAARLLPSGDVEDAEDLALLEVRDLLFARLLQYRAYKQVAMLFAELEAAALRRYPRSVSVEDRFADLIPEVLLGVDPARFADIAATAFRPKPIPQVGLDHIHQHAVSVPEQAAWVMNLLQGKGSGQWATFGEIIEGCEYPVEIIARFLALLELFREQVIVFEQPEPLGELSVSWTGTEKVDGVLVSAVDYG